ncbi:MAG: hypothetical protein M5R41_00255 [Bacteroidia bacterium]|nr:hypothetical protein [Bacteroidia bacterium]
MIQYRTFSIASVCTLSLLAGTLVFFSGTTAHAQPLRVERSINGVPDNPFSFLAASMREQDRLDFNGDGYPDRVFISSDPATGDVMRIVDGMVPTREWIMRLDGDPDYPIIVGRHSLVGFYNLDGVVSNENPKELVFAYRVFRPQAYLTYRLEDVMVTGYNATNPTVRPQPLGIIAILIGIVDSDRDGKDEVLTFDPDRKVTEIWGVE